MSFANLKKNRSKAREAIKEALTSKGGKSSNQRQSDDRMWYPKTDEAGNGYAVIRFMPPAKDNNLPWAKMFKHRFKENGQWFIAECPTTIDKDCPVCSANSELWKTESKANRSIASTRKRKIEYYLNVLVEKDSATPENEGQVKIFRCGVKLFEKLQNAQNPEFEDEQPIDPFDFWEGASFKLKIRKVEGQTNYDKSEFNDPSELFDGDDDRLEEVYNQLHDLREFISEDKFADYDALESRFNRVIGAENVKNAPTSAEAMMEKKVAKAAPAEEAPSAEPDLPESSDSGEEEDAFAMFQRLAEED